MTAVDKLDWELRVREGARLKLCGMRETSLGEQTLVQMTGTNAELRASLYKALALLGDDGSQGRPPANADELAAVVDGVKPAASFFSRYGVGGGGGAGGGGGRQRGPFCAYCGSGVDGGHTAGCARPDPL